MRGKGVLVLLRCDDLGITPAYAGKRKFAGYYAAIDRDHPRLCGEKLYPALIADSVPGSPPPMRGKALERLYSV